MSWVRMRNARLPRVGGEQQSLEATALTRLEELLGRAEGLMAQQGAGVVAERGAVQQRTKVRVALQRKLLRYLAGVGAVAAKENVLLAAEFGLPPNRVTDLAFVTLAKGMLEKATARKELLMKQGLSEGVLADFATALQAFEQTLEATRAARRNVPPHLSMSRCPS